MGIVYIKAFRRRKRKPKWLRRNLREITSSQWERKKWIEKNRGKLNAQSKTEQALERLLKKNGIRFVRNSPLVFSSGQIIFLDFLLADRKIVIELDGPEHDPKSDRERDWMVKKKCGYKTIRIKNSEFWKDPTKVLGSLRQKFGPIITTPKN